MRSTLLHLRFRGALRAFLGGPPATLFFAFEPMFVASKRAPETKVEQDKRFQTLRNPMVFMIFLGDHGNTSVEIHFGLIFVSFWIKISEKSNLTTKIIPNEFKMIPNDI